MDIAVCLDKNFVMPTGIMMTSLCENNREQELVFHVISADITEDGKRDLNDITEKYGKEIHFYHIDNSLLNKFPIGEKWQNPHMQSLASYYRLFLGSILPERIKKVIYLDGDIIVSASLKELWDTELTGVGIAAVPDVFYCWNYHYKRLGYPMASGYCNAGVLLINLEYWRENKAENEFFDFIRTSSQKIKCHDQDVLNWTFRDRKVILPLKFNVQQDFLYSWRHQKFSRAYEQELEVAQTQPVIIHYIYGVKPWHQECLNPYRSEFLRYKALSKWADLPLDIYFNGRGKERTWLKELKYKIKNSPAGRWAIKNPTSV